MLRSKEGNVDRNSVQLIRYYVRKIFEEKSTEIVYQKTGIDLFVILVNSPIYSQFIKTTLLHKIFWKKIIENPEKGTFLFSNHSLF